MKILFILAVLSALATLAILAVGAIGMAKGSDFNQKYGNKLMQARVMFQALTLILLFLAATT